MPALWFRYDLSPITVAYTEKRQPFYHFLTMVRALVDHMLLSVYYCMCSNQVILCKRPVKL